MSNMKEILLGAYAIIGVALIGLGIFKKIKLYEGEKVKNLKQLKLVNTTSSILFGLIFIAEAYFCYIDKLHWGFLIASMAIVEIFQRKLYDFYIIDSPEEEDRGTSDLAKNIGLDEIMEDDFFNKKQEKEEEEKQQELLKQQYENYERKQKEETKRIFADLLMEGISLGIIPDENTEKEEIEVNKEIIEDKEDKEDIKNNNIISVDFNKKEE